MFLRDLLQPMHLIVLLVIYLLFFGTKKVPQFGKQLGEGLKGIREGLREGQEDHVSVVSPSVVSPSVVSPSVVASSVAPGAEHSAVESGKQEAVAK